MQEWLAVDDGGQLVAAEAGRAPAGEDDAGDARGAHRRAIPARGPGT